MESVFEEYKQALLLLLAFGIMIGTPFVAEALVPGMEEWEPEPKEMEVVMCAAPIPSEVPEEDALIEAALQEQGYYRDDIPLTYLEQDLLQSACDETGVDYALALAVIEQETGFRNIMGDDGASAGYMQVQARWWSSLMDKLGVTDLMDPYGNFRVGCAILAQHIDRYGLPDALTVYNTGHTGESEYSRSVMALAEKWKEQLK